MNARTSVRPDTGETHQPIIGSARKRDRVRLLQATEALIIEFSEQLPAGVVIACVARCKAELAASGVRNGLPVATEAAARTRLASLSETRGCVISA